MPNILVDGDACPVKTEVLRVAARHGLQVYMVSNQGLRASVAPNVTGILVGPEFDAADNWIAEHVQDHDIVVTADIQLAARCLRKAAKVLAPDGRVFSPQNIGAALAARELSAYLREAGEIKGYNKSFSNKDRSQFLQALEKLVRDSAREAAG